MMDYCTKTAIEAEFDVAMLACGLLGEDGEPSSQYVCIDRIGSITLDDGTFYPEYYTNVRLLIEPTAEQVTALESMAVDPSQPQYRVWA